MTLMTTPVCDFGKKALPFKLQSVDGKFYTLEDIQGPNGVLMMFICNHCPYVKAILPRLVEDVRVLLGEGIGCVAINANDSDAYPEDSFENMRSLAKKMKFPCQYLIDESQEIAKAYGAICTPDFFGYNSNLELQYRGRFDDTKLNQADQNTQHELLDAMRLIKETGQGPKAQTPSMGCSIKWK